mgnify:CR=1 FL=1
MKDAHGSPLLTANDVPPVRITNRLGTSSFLLIGDHAGNLVPECLDNLGLGPDEMNRHIALDLGISEAGRRLAATLDAPFVEQRYSRLVIDCNRRLGDPDSILVESDGTIVPGNQNLAVSSIESRIDEVYRPYHDTIHDLLSKRDEVGLQTVLVSLHSFTPKLSGRDRSWQIGVLYDGGDNRFARLAYEELRKTFGAAVGDNEPYRMDGTDFTVPWHAYSYHDLMSNLNCVRIGLRRRTAKRSRQI